MSVLDEVVMRVGSRFVYFILCLLNDSERGGTKWQVKGKYTKRLVDLLHMSFVSSF